MNVRQSADTTHTAVCSSKADRSGIVTQITATMQGDRKQLHFSFHSAVHKATHFHSDINAHPVPPRLPPAHPPAVLSFTFFFFCCFCFGSLSSHAPLFPFFLPFNSWPPRLSHDPLLSSLFSSSSCFHSTPMLVLALAADPSMCTETTGAGRPTVNHAVRANEARELPIKHTLQGMREERGGENGRQREK